MTITITSNAQVFNAGISQSVENLTQSTATGLQTLSLKTDISNIGMGTATGFGINRYLLPAGQHGQEKWLVAQATGEAYVQLAAGTATGALVFTSTQQAQVVFMDTIWALTYSRGPTIATATMTA